MAVLGGCHQPADRPQAAAPPNAAADTAKPPKAGVAVYAGDAMVRGYHPRSSLVVRQTPLTTARFPVIDIHCHWTLDADPVALLAAMDDRNVRVAVNLSGGWGAQLDRMLARFTAVAPDRLLIFGNIDFSRISEPDFAATTSRWLETVQAQGVRGLKVFKELGLRVRDAQGRIVPLDDPRLDPIWETCGRLGLPVLWHTADPAPFFEPVDERNERWMQLQRHPDWSFYGPPFPDRKALFDQRARVMRRHGDTTFICAHVASHASDLAAAGRLLDQHPNAYLDISGRVGELGRQPFTARRFFLQYQDRILFGTDRYPGRAEQPRYRIYYRFLETDDEYFDYYDHDFPPAGEWKIYGVGLPDEVLRKVYYANAQRLLAGIVIEPERGP
ncbi:MAG: amidohydrolase family protein [Planctomycetales bacterium]|nr:amidohydrolase family protein [Planctomycetales bacterium]